MAPRTPQADEPGTDLAVASRYPVLAGENATAVIEAIRVNLGGEQIAEGDLDRVKIPTGGGTVWEIPTLEGVEATRELEGIIVFSKSVRAYWPGKYEGGSEPPACSSKDAVIGVGDPGGECALCPLAQFGSHRDGTAQACRQMRQLFLLTEESMLPLIVNLPPTSLKGARQYLIRLAAKGLAYRHIETKLALEKVKGGQADYSVATFAAGRILEEPERRLVDAYATALEPSMRAAPVNATQAEDDGT